MKKIILYLMFLTITIFTYGQNTNKDSVDIISNYSRVIVKITAVTVPISKTGQSIKDKEIILLLSKLKPLKKMNYQLINGKLDLNLTLVFSNMNSYYKWRENEEIEKLLDLINVKFKGYNIEITLVKQAQLDG